MLPVRSGAACALRARGRPPFRLPAFFSSLSSMAVWGAVFHGRACRGFACALDFFNWCCSHPCQHFPSFDSGGTVFLERTLRRHWLQEENIGTEASVVAEVEVEVGGGG